MTMDSPLLAVPISERDHMLGPANAPVSLVEYGDFECPYCGRAYPVVEEIRRRLGDRLCFVYRHFPLTQIHPHAQHAAEAAEAAGAQGRFWAMHGTLFENQHALTDADLARYAAAIGLDLARFTQEMEAGIYIPRVREDFLSGVRSGVNGTPTFFINGRRHDGGADLKSLVEAIVHATLPAPAIARGARR
ncbi:MAG: hypothetical protein QOF51_810 [Chloroflexota bacterium]|nr:hypothetical protein [Chloroflexota bacterium]